MFKLNFSNAFNSLCWRDMLMAVKDRLLELYTPIVTWLYIAIPFTMAQCIYTVWSNGALQQDEPPT